MSYHIVQKNSKQIYSKSGDFFFITATIVIFLMFVYLAMVNKDDN